jgi:predicted FMN-binding regulatory protein PaiB
MYVSPHFAERDLSILHDMIETVRFGTLVLCAEGVSKLVVLRRWDLIRPYPA